MTNPPLQPGRDHAVSAAQAADMTRRHRALEGGATASTTGAASGDTITAASGGVGGVGGARPADEGSFGGMFSKKAVLSLLSRADAQYLRYYHARDASGKRTIILVAADANGNDLLDGGAQTLDHHWPCPPYCPPEASALRG